MQKDTPTAWNAWFLSSQEGASPVGSLARPGRLLLPAPSKKPLLKPAADMLVIEALNALASSCNSIAQTLQA